MTAAKTSSLSWSSREKMRRFLLFVTGYLLLVTLLTGCASIPAVKEAEFPVQKFYLNKTIYYPLSGVCSYLKIDCDYDSIGREIVLKKADTEVKLLLDSSMILVNGSPLDIENPVLIHNGQAVVPLKFKKIVLDKFYCQIVPRGVPQPALMRGIRMVVVDAGHGGNDPGAIGRTGLREKDVNLDIARRLVESLKSLGIDAIMTRSSDRFITLEGRADIANRANADFFISIHSNAARSRSLSGFEVYYITEKLNDYSRALLTAKNSDLNLEPGSFYKSSLDLKATLWDMIYTHNRSESILLAQSICQAANRNMGLKILGVKGAPFYVLKGTHVPAVLVEVGFVSNPTEEKYLRNGFYRQQLAEVIAEGVVNYACLPSGRGGSMIWQAQHCNDKSNRGF